MNKQFFIFIINGLAATIVHLLLLIIFTEIFKIDSIVVSNAAAGLFAIMVSFFGNRRFVFKSKSTDVYSQIFKFLILYLSILTLHTLLMTFLTVNLNLDYRISFVIVSANMALASFFMNKLIVFKA
jgi:putative flippase GtrA